MAARKTETKRGKGPSTAAPKSKQRATRASAPLDTSLADKLAEMAWREADTALAEALADLDEVETALNEVARAEALAMLAQSLARAARRRGLTRDGALGVQEAFDAKRHELTTAIAKPPQIVRIQARGVARGGEILVRPRVAPVKRKRPR